MKRFTLFVSIALMFVLVLSLVGVSQAAPDNNSKTRVFVQFLPNGKGPVQKALKNAGAEFHYEFDELNTFAVSLPSAALDGISRNPNVVLVEEDSLRFPIGVMESSYQSPAGQTIPYGIDMVQARDVWDANRDGVVDSGAVTASNRKVCIIDSGYYTGHEDLPAASGFDGNLPWAEDGSGHGTHVAGTIAAMNNTLGVVGVTPGTVQLYIVRVFGNDGTWAYSSSLIDAAYKCRDAGANIISMSLGGSRSNRTEMNGFATLYNTNGILSIAAAGNAGTNAHSYPASYDSVVSVAAIDSNKVVASFSQYNNQVELAAPGVGVLSTVPYLDSTSITVSGLTYSAGHIEFSARGTASGALVDGGLCDSTNTTSWSGKVVLCERGVISFYDKVRNVQLSGGAAAALYNNVPGGFLGTLGAGNSSTIIGISLSQEDGQFLVANRLGQSATVSSTYTAPASGYEYYDGTSMATPHVSAVAALVWSAKTTATNAEIRTVLQQTAQDLGAAGRDNYYGYGLVQAKTAIVALTGGGGSNNPPSVSITSPSNGATFASGTSILFSGSASDTEDGNLTSSLVWVSSLDGQIGTGGSFSAVLSDGTHTITASVTDSGGSSGSDSVTITVSSGSGGGLTLSVLAYKVIGNKYADLTWSGATSTHVNVYRNGALVITTANNGAFTDGPLGRGGGSATYQVCEAGTNVCSNTVTVSW